MKVDCRQAMQAGLVFCLLISLSNVVFGQTPETSWDNLQRLTIGQQIQIVDMKLKSTEGEFRSFSDQTISLKRGKDDLVFQRIDVFRVNARGGGRLKNSLAGATFGLLIGIIGGAVVDALDDVDRSDSGANNGKLAGATVGFGIGAALGAAFPGSHTIYRSATSKD